MTKKSRVYRLAAHLIETEVEVFLCLAVEEAMTAVSHFFDFSSEIIDHCVVNSLYDTMSPVSYTNTPDERRSARVLFLLFLAEFEESEASCVAS